MRRFSDRGDAGRVLARELAGYAGRSDVVVLALPRGGVPVGCEIARELNAPLDIFLVRKLGFPGHEEFALGAIASGGVRVLNPEACRFLHFTAREIDRISARELRELERREQSYRGRRPLSDLHGKMAIVVDDGLATESTMRAAVQALRELAPKRIVVAVPVCSSTACELLSREADEVLCAIVPEHFCAVSEWYEDFAQTSDQEVHQMLDEAHFSA